MKAIFPEFLKNEVACQEPAGSGMGRLPELAAPAQPRLPAHEVRFLEELRGFLPAERSPATCRLHDLTVTISDLVTKTSSCFSSSFSRIHSNSS